MYIIGKNEQRVVVRQFYKSALLMRDIRGAATRLTSTIWPDMAM